MKCLKCLVLALLASGTVCAANREVVVPPLTEAMWNQGRHYNRLCPTTNVSTCPDGRMWAGCTAVATAIVMKYYEWPREGETYYQTLNDEKSWENDTTSIALRARFYRPYAWEKMQNVYGNVTSAEASLAVGELMSDIGAVMYMNYGTSGSSTSRDNVADVLVHNFHFDASEFYQCHVENGRLTPQEEKRLQDQLQEGHPIVAAGAAGASGTGHTYVCDGYARETYADGSVTNLYHFNFGWGGASNGWYPLNAVFTSAKPNEQAVQRPVEDMFLGLYPQKAPQIHSAANVTGPTVTLDWSLATCWTNRVTGYRLERQDRVRVPVNVDLTNAWSVRSSGWGWEIVSGVPVASAKRTYYGSYWPTLGISANTTNALAVSSATTVTIRYRAKKFPNGVTLSLIKSDADGAETDLQNKELPTLANLPGGSSTTAFEEKTVTVSGTTLVNAFGLDPAYFALRFKDPNGDTTYYSTEVFRLVSFTVTGEGEGWETQATEQIAAPACTYSWPNQPTGDHRYVLTAVYPNLEASASVVKTVRATAPALPQVTLVSAVGQTLSFAVANTSSYTFKFETQSNILRGTGTKSGNTVTYAFTNEVATLGTHWIALTVTDTATGASGRYVHIVNPPTDHPLCPYTERSIAAAASRARREGKLVLLVESGDPDATKFLALSGLLSSNAVVSAISEKYIVAETIAAVPSQRTVGESYWRAQPQMGYGLGLTTYQPDITAYAVVINPENPSVPYACDTLPGYYMNALSRWNYFNSQYDMGNLGYASVVRTAMTELVRFLGQSGFVVTAEPDDDPEPSIEGGVEVGTIAVNAAGEYVVTLQEGIGYVSIQDAGAHVIVVPPSVLAVMGVAPEKLKVAYGTQDLSAAFAKIGDASGLYLMLDETASVRVGGEDIRVKPEFTSAADALKPLVVSATAVSVGAKTIPGLVYALVRRSAPADAAAESCVATVTASGARTELKDPNPPAGQAFYVLRVSSVQGD